MDKRIFLTLMKVVCSRVRKSFNSFVISGAPNEKFIAKCLKYRVALNFCGSLILRIVDFLCFAGTKFCALKGLVFLSGN